MVKGLSPLIATVLLIGFTIAVGGVLGIFVNNYMKNQTESIVEPCTGVVIDLRAEINKTDGVKLTYQYAMGKQKLKNVTVTVICDNIKQEELSKEIVPGYVNTTIITGLNGCDAETNFEAYLYAECNGYMQKITECTAGNSCVKNV